MERRPDRRRSRPDGARPLRATFAAVPDASSASSSRPWHSSATSPTSRRRCCATSSAPRPTSSTFFTELGPFTEASRPAFRSLGQTSIIGNKALNDSRRRDRPSSTALAAERPARWASRCASSCRRSTTATARSSRTPRAKASAPPAPDPTAYKDGQGFTGFEALLNYAYWQTLAINPFDQLGHVLRVLCIVGPCCGNYQTGAGYESDTEARTLFDKCNSWLGPNQPGVTTPDPTGDGRQQAARPSDDEEAQRRRWPRPAGGQAPARPARPRRSRRSRCRPRSQQLLDTLKVPGTAPSLPQLPGGLPQLPQD